MQEENFRETLQASLRKMESRISFVDPKFIVKSFSSIIIFPSLSWIELASSMYETIRTKVVIDIKPVCSFHQSQSSSFFNNNPGPHDEVRTILLKYLSAKGNRNLINIKMTLQTNKLQYRPDKYINNYLGSFLKTSLKNLSTSFFIELQLTLLT